MKKSLTIGITNKTRNDLNNKLNILNDLLKEMYPLISEINEQIFYKIRNEDNLFKRDYKIDVSTNFDFIKKYIQELPTEFETNEEFYQLERWYNQNKDTVKGLKNKCFNECWEKIIL